jgi:hypothetical protein
VIFITWDKWSEVHDFCRTLSTVDDRANGESCNYMMQQGGKLGNALAISAYPELHETPGDRTVDLHLSDGRTIEVKLDIRGSSTGNLFYEVLSTGHTSAFIKDNPDFVIFFLPGMPNLKTTKIDEKMDFGYLLDNNLLRKHIEERFCMTMQDIAFAARAGKIKQWSWYGNNEFAYVYSKYKTSGILIPWKTNGAVKVPLEERPYFIEKIIEPERKFPR